MPFQGIQPANVKMIPASGSGSMGDVTDATSVCRFFLTGKQGQPVPFRLVFLRALFTGGTGQANMSLIVDNILGTQFDHTLLTLKDAGTDTWAKINVRIDPAERDNWVCKGGDILVLEWTNPNTQIWGIEVGLQYAGEPGA